MEVFLFLAFWVQLYVGVFNAPPGPSDWVVSLSLWAPASFFIVFTILFFFPITYSGMLEAESSVLFKLSLGREVLLVCNMSTYGLS